MAREHLSKRGKWQGEAGARGQSAEDMLFVVMDTHLEDTPIEVVHKPKDLRGIYGEHDKSGKPHGIEPELSFRNTENGKMIFVETKRQKAGGNAHERACKYFAPGIVASMREIANQPPNVLPCWFIFSNGIARDSRYRQEILHWFRGFEAHVFLWENVRDRKALIAHFNEHIRPLLI